LRGLEARGGCGVIPWGGEGKCEQKSMDEAFLQEKVACLDCPLTKNSLKEVCRGLIDLSTMSHGSTVRSCQTSWVFPLFYSFDE
jgi:hypothetical protein